MPAKVKQIMTSGMCTDESLSLPLSLELPHPPLPDSGRLMRLLGPIILILFGAVDRLRDQFTMCHAITPELVRYNFPGFIAMASQ